MTGITRSADSSMSSVKTFQSDSTLSPIEYTTVDLPLGIQPGFSDNLKTGRLTLDNENIENTIRPSNHDRFDESFPMVDEPEDMEGFVPEPCAPGPRLTNSDLKDLDDHLAEKAIPQELPKCIAMSGHMQPKSRWRVFDHIAPAWRETNLSYEGDLLGFKTGAKRRWQHMESLKQFVERPNRELLPFTVLGQEPDGFDMLHLTKPIDACYKTLSEAATIHFVGESSSVDPHAVPRVLSYNADHRTGQKNLEWIFKSVQQSSLIQTKQNKPQNLAQIWPSLSLDEKKGYLDQIADINLSMFNRTHKVIGSIYFGRDIAQLEEIHWPNGRSPLKSSNVMRTLSQRKPWVVSRLVSKDLIRRDRNIVPAIDRGPYATSFEFYSERLRVLVAEYNRDILEARKKGKKEELENLQQARNVVAKVGQRLANTLVQDPEPETFRLYREWSLSDFALLANGKLHALDWDFTYFAPAWLACRTPDFLAKETNEVRDHYFSTLKGSSPLLDRLFAESNALLDLDEAIRIVDERRSTEVLEQWLDDMNSTEKGSYSSVAGLRTRKM